MDRRSLDTQPALAPVERAAFDRAGRELARPRALGAHELAERNELPTLCLQAFQEVEPLIQVRLSFDVPRYLFKLQNAPTTQLKIHTRTKR